MKRLHVNSYIFDIFLKSPIRYNSIVNPIMTWRHTGDSHYLNQWWPIHDCSYVSKGLQKCNIDNESMLFLSWWRHQMKTFTGPLCGEFTGHRWIPLTKASDVSFDLRLNKRLSKQSWGWWLRRHRAHYDVIIMCNRSFLLHSIFSTNASPFFEPINSLAPGRFKFNFR